jgi:hypothetical protein
MSSEPMPSLSRRRLLGSAAAVGAGAVLGPALARAASAAPPGPLTAYVMGHFTESPNGLGNNFGLHLAYSRDGLNWTSLNGGQPVFTPTLGERGMRDPFVFRKEDGSFGVVATNMWNSNQLHVIDSPDLISYQNARMLTVNSTPGMHAWAPEAFWDASRGQYGIVWAGNSDHHREYVNYTTDFRTVSAPQVYFDPGFDVIDATFDEQNGRRYMYFAGREHIQGARADSLAPRSFDNGIYTGLIGPAIIEGPELLKKINESRWYLYGDHWSPSNAIFRVWETTDLGANNWAEVSQTRYTTPINCKHASTLAVTATELDRLIAAWGNPYWSRLKSYNFPGSYVRHANFLGRIDPYPFDPFQDAMWRVVPGLADASAVTFESVNMPGYYLRHANSWLRVDRDEGTALFRADATFRRVAGLANGAATSFQSYNFPDRYIRHTNSQLRIDPMTNDLDRADATFFVVS